MSTDSEVLSGNVLKITEIHEEIMLENVGKPKLF